MAKKGDIMFCESFSEKVMERFMCPLL